MDAFLSQHLLHRRIISSPIDRAEGADKIGVDSMILATTMKLRHSLAALTLAFFLHHHSDAFQGGYGESALRCVPEGTGPRHLNRPLHIFAAARSGGDSTGQWEAV
jgi:hypothetical protein